MELVDEDRFYPELMSGFVVTRGIWDVFKEKNKGYDFKQATLDPLYQPNKADSDEIKMIDAFRASPDLQMLEGVIDKSGEKYFYLAYPIKVDAQDCLRCHGDPVNAPRDQIEIYGTGNGYHWQIGDTVSAYVIYVSIQEALASAKQMAGMLFLVGIGCFFLALPAAAQDLKLPAPSPLAARSLSTSIKPVLPAPGALNVNAPVPEVNTASPLVMLLVPAFTFITAVPGCGTPPKVSGLLSWMSAASVSRVQLSSVLVTKPAPSKNSVRNGTLTGNSSEPAAVPTTSRPKRRVAPPIPVMENRSQVPLSSGS